MDEKYFNDDEEDEITYKTTDFLKSPEEHEEEKYGSKKSGGILIFFAVLSLILIALCLYIYLSKNTEIKFLKNSLASLEASSQRSNKEYSIKIESLERDLKHTNEVIQSLSATGKEYSDSLLKTRSTLEKTESEKKNLQSNVDDLSTKLDTSESNLKAKDQELTKTKNDRKKAEDDLMSAGKRISSLENELEKTRSDVSFWQKKYEKLNKEQTDAVNDILASAKLRQKAIDGVEQDLFSTYEKSELYYSLIGWEENFKLTNRVPMSKLSQKPVLLTTSRPVYPDSAARNKIEGIVILKGVLTESGKITNPEILYSPQDNAALGEAAKTAVLNYRYKPAMKDNQAVKVVLVIPVEFQLNNSSSQ